jgi:hypothetical protein
MARLVTVRSAGAAPSTIAGMIRGHRKVGSERVRGMNDALHGREAWRRPGKRDRDRLREVGSRVSAHHGPGEATLTPVILVRIQVPKHKIN